MIETGRFRTAVVGGFNRADVIAYIEKLAREREQFRTEREKLTDKYEAAVRELEEAGERIARLEGGTADTDSLNAQLETVRGQLETAEREIAGLRGQLRESGGAAEELRGLRQGLAEKELEAYRRAEIVERSSFQLLKRIFADAEDIVCAIKGKYVAAADGIESASANIITEMSKIGGGVTGLTAEMETADRKIEELEAMLRDGKRTAGLLGVDTGDRG